MQCAIALEIHRRGCGEVSALDCESDFECSGDAVQCAIASRQQALACAAVQDDYGLGDAFDGLSKGDSEIKGQLAVGEVSIADALQTGSLIGSGSCVDDYVVEIMGTSIAIPFSQYCPYLRAMGALLVASSLLIAAMIVSIAHRHLAGRLISDA